MSSYHSATELPSPGVEQIEHSSALIELIIKRIEQAGGVIPFSDYMHMCLYEPGLGYYSSGSTKFGAAGDFITAPEVSPLFGQCIAHHAIELIEQGMDNRFFELGAGSGKLCRDIIQAFEQQEREWQQYLILEPSADLQQRQQAFLEAELTPAQYQRIHWLGELPGQFNGLILGNEVLDAMPVHVVLKDSQWLELGVGFADGRFQWVGYAKDSEAIKAISKIGRDLDLDDGYCSEVNLNYAPWFNSLFGSCNDARVLLIDYGYEQSQYYHPQRKTGTLMCFYQHRSHPDPFVYPGLQDITAFVDFDAVGDAAAAAGFAIEGLTSQAEFLMSNGLMEQMSASDDPMLQLELAQQVKTLTLPGEMGEKFKVLRLSKHR